MKETNMYKKKRGMKGLWIARDKKLKYSNNAFELLEW